MGAYNIFRNVMDIHESLLEHEKDSPLKDIEAYNNQLFLIVYAALLGEQYELAKPYYQERQENNYDDPSLYEGLFQIQMQEDPDAASAILQEGREKYPDDLTLLYAEINMALDRKSVV